MLDVLRFLTVTVGSVDLWRLLCHSMLHPKWAFLFVHKRGKIKNRPAFSAKATNACFFLCLSAELINVSGWRQCPHRSVEEANSKILRVSIIS